MIVVGYARVSSLEQAVNSQALEQQIDRLKTNGATKVYVDVESGYKKKHRPQLDLLIQKVKNKEVDRVIVTRLDRLSRQGKQSLSFFDIFIESDVDLKVLDEPIELHNAAGKLSAGMLALIAQHHSDQKSEAVSNGWAYLRKTHKAVNPPFGYIIKADKFTFDNEPFLSLLSTKRTLSKRQIAEDLVDIYLTKKTLRLALREINSKYGIENYSYGSGNRVRYLFRFSVAGFSSWLENPVLRGHTCYLAGRQHKKPPIIIENTHTDILISQQSWEQVKYLKETNKVIKRHVNTEQKYPLSGLVYCNECRAACYSLSGSRGKNVPGYNYYYQCKNWRTRSCSNRSLVRMDYLEDEVINILTSEVYAAINAKKALTTQAVSKHNQEITKLKEQLVGLEQLGYNPAFTKAKEELKQQILLLEATQNTTPVDNQLYKRALEIFSSPEFFKIQDSNQRMLAYRTIIDRIWVDKGKLIKVDLKI